MEVACVAVFGLVEDGRIAREKYDEATCIEASTGLPVTNASICNLVPIT